jgi:hypothetical protein
LFIIWAATDNGVAGQQPIEIIPKPRSRRQMIAMSRSKCENLVKGTHVAVASYLKYFAYE